MSVRQWKRVITLCVITTIILLLLLTIFFGLRSRHYNNLIESGELINLTEYGTIDDMELSSLVHYLESVEVDSNLDYQSLFPNLYVENDFQFVKKEQKTCYLTFDDGPSESNTAQVLDILKRYDIKATFFVVYNDSPSANDLYKRIVDEGHTIGIHTYTHDYEYIYSSVEAYLTDFEKMATHIEDVTGVKPVLFRFPGGSINTYNIHIYRATIAEMLRRGYVYYDWNVSSGDAASAYVSSEDILKNTIKGAENAHESIVLMHDGPGHATTVEALPSIIDNLQKQGYTFDRLDKTTTPFCFGY